MKDFQALHGGGRSIGHWANILNGRIANSTATAEKGNRSRLDSDDVEAVRQALWTVLDIRIAKEFFTAPLALAVAVAWLRQGRSSPPDRMRREASLTRIPEFDSESSWSKLGILRAEELTTWLSDPPTTPSSAFGLLGESLFGKTVLVSSVLRQRPDLTVLWFDCEKVAGYEHLVEDLLLRLLELDGNLEGGISNSIEERLSAIRTRLARRPEMLCVFDGAERLMVDHGYMVERPKDELVLEVVRTLIADIGVRSIVSSRLPILLLGDEVSWLPSDSPFWIPPATSDSQARTGLDRLLRPFSEVSQRDWLVVEDIVEAVLDAADPVQVELFALITLLGEEIWIGTLRWYCAEILSIPGSAVQATLDAFWDLCARHRITALRLRLPAPFDDGTNEAQQNLDLHFRFHDSIVLTAARKLETGVHRSLARRVHRRIAARAYEVAQQQTPEYLRGKNAMEPVLRPVQVIKHLLASVETLPAPTPGWRLPSAISGRSDSPKDRAVFTDVAAPTEVVEFCHSYFRRHIDRPDDFAMSRTSGADRPKLDLLLRFFALGRSTDIGQPADSVALPPIPMFAIIDILTGIAIAGLNSGALSEAGWAAAKAVDLLAIPPTSVHDVVRHAKFVSLLTRVRVDVLIRSGKLLDAQGLCLELLASNSAFRKRNPLRSSIQKLQLRHAHVSGLLRGPTEAARILDEFLFSDNLNDEIDFAAIDLSGASGRIAVGVLLRTLKTRGQAQDARTLERAKQIHENNWKIGHRQRNEAVALLVERCTVDLISAIAIQERRRSLVDTLTIAPCRDLLAKAHRTAWERGVSPVTRLDLLMQSARLEYLDNKLDLAGDLAGKAEKHAHVFGYRIHQIDALLLKAEILWAVAERDDSDAHRLKLQDDAEDILHTILPLEHDTQYMAAHPRVAGILSSNYPTRVIGL